MTLPVEPQPFERMSTLEMVHRIHREINTLQRSVLELEARMESAFPGADLNRHREDHDTIHENALEAKQMRKAFWDRSVAGLWAGFWALVIAGVAMLVGLKFWK